MNSEWQPNPDFGGFAELLPPLPPPETEDDMRSTKTKPTITAMFTCHFDNGEQVGPIIVSESVGKDCDAEKVFLRLAAMAAHRLQVKVRSD